MEYALKRIDKDRSILITQIEHILRRHCPLHVINGNLDIKESLDFGQKKNLYNVQLKVEKIQGTKRGSQQEEHGELLWIRECYEVQH